MTNKKMAARGVALLLVATLVLHAAGADWATKAYVDTIANCIDIKKGPIYPNIYALSTDMMRTREDAAECNQTCAAKPPGEQ